MAYFVQGDALNLFKAFDQEWMIVETPNTYNNLQLMESDLLETRFLGTKDQAKQFLNTWKAKGQGTYYLPGNGSASNLFCLMGASQPFYKENENFEEYLENKVHLHFAYVNEKQELCGFMLLYRKDNPAQWMIGLTKNNHLAPKDRTITYLSSVDLNPYLVTETQGIAISSVNPLKNPLLLQIDSPILHNFLQNIIREDTGTIDIGSERLMHLLRPLHYKAAPILMDPLDLSLVKAASLFEENMALDLITRHKLHLSSTMLYECLDKTSGLQQELKTIRLVDDEQIDKNLLQMVILFHEQKILEKNRAFLQNQVFVKTMSGLIWNNAQINLIPYLVNNNFEIDLFHLILSEEAYYSAVHILAQLGYDEDISQFLTNPQKRQELEYIHSIDSIHTRKLCLIFWAKGELTSQEYKLIVKATLDYPMLAETLVALDQTDVMTINSLKELALNPNHHQILSILYHFEAQMGLAGLKRTDLKQLDPKELPYFTRCFSVLKKAGIKTGDSYHLALSNSRQGKLLRLFLPCFDKIDYVNHCKELIDILYIGIKQGSVSQGKAIQQITDTNLFVLAKNLHERFICAKQMQELDFEKNIIALAAEEGGTKGIRFRKIILRVEEQCKIVHERLRGSMADKEKAVQWQNADKNYRRMLYSIAYDGLTKPGIDILSRIEEVEKEVLKIVDPEIRSLFYKVLIVIANILITALTLGKANDIKEKSTGNYWFFNQSQMGEKIRFLNKEIIELINSPEPDPGLTP